MVRNLEEAPHFYNLIHTNKLVLVDFYATWCGPCKVLSPIIEEVAKHYKDDDRVVIAKFNVDTDDEPVIKFNIRSVPVCMLFNDGHYVDRLTGMNTKEKLIDWIDSHLSDL